MTRDSSTGADLPSGTITFLFTDIEGSTRLWEEDATRMKTDLERHDEIVLSAIDRHGGHVFNTVGDGFWAAFERAPQAVEAALVIQLDGVSSTTDAGRRSEPD